MNTITKQSAPVIIAVVIAITILEVYALSQGINGLLLTGVIGVLAAIVGVKAGKVLEHRCIAKNNKEVDSIPPSAPSEGEPKR